MRRRTFVDLTGISLAGALLPSAAGTSPATGIAPLVPFASRIGTRR